MNVLLNLSEREEVRKLADHRFVHIELPTERTRCNVACKKSLYVSPIGDVTPCPFMPFSFGNTRERTLKEIWGEICEKLPTPKPGDCPMNDPEFREKYIECTPQLEKVDSKEG